MLGERLLKCHGQIVFLLIRILARVSGALDRRGHDVESELVELWSDRRVATRELFVQLPLLRFGTGHSTGTWSLGSKANRACPRFWWWNPRHECFVRSH